MTLPRVSGQIPRIIDAASGIKGTKSLQQIVARNSDPGKDLSVSFRV